MKPISILLIALVLAFTFGAQAVYPQAALASTGERRDVDGEPGVRETSAAVSDGIDLQELSHLGENANAVAVRGRYAYVGTNTHVEVVDISIPNHPRRVGRSGRLCWEWSLAALAIEGERLYVACGTSLHILQTSDQGQLAELGFYAGYISKILVDGNLVATYSSGPLMLLDVSDPRSVKVKATLDLFAEDFRGVFALHGQHLYVAVSKTLRIFDISDPGSPVRVADFDAGAPIRGINVAGDFAHLATASELHIIDVTQVAAPRRVGRLDLSYTSDQRNVLLLDGTHLLVSALVGQGYTQLHPGLTVIDIADVTSPRIAYSLTVTGPISSIVAASQYVYLANGTGGLRIFGVRSPSSMLEIGAYDPSGYVTDAEVLGSFAYVLDAWQGLQIFDISSPAFPREISRLTLPGEPSSIEISGDFAYVTAKFSGFHIIDISDHVAPTLMGSERTPGEANDVVMSGQYAYVADGSAGLSVLSIQDPHQPSLVATFDTPGYVKDVAIEHGMAYVADGEAGFSVIDVSNPTEPRLRGVLTLDNDLYEPVTVEANGNYAIVGDGPFMKIIDVHDVDRPSLIAGARRSLRGFVLDLNVKNSIAYFSTRDGLAAFDIMNPLTPILLLQTKIDGTPAERISVADGIILAARLDKGFTVFAANTTSTGMVTVQGGGRFTSSADGISYDFAPGSFPADATVTHSLRVLSNNLQPPPGLAATSIMFEVSAAARPWSLQTSSQPFTMTVPVPNQADVLGTAIEDTLSLYYRLGTTWVREESSSFDIHTRTLSARSIWLGPWAVMGETYVVFSPLVSTPVSVHSSPPPDLTIKAIEITQGIQTTANDVALVENRPALLRLYPTTNTTTPVVDVHMLVVGLRDGVELPGSPIVLGPYAIYPDPGRTLPGKSVNVMLPQDWLSGTVTLGARVDAGDVIVETNENNNTVFQTSTFLRVPPLAIKFVPVNLIDSSDGSYVPASTAADVGTQWVRRVYPLDNTEISFHVPIEFTWDGQDYSSMKSGVLNRIGSLKMSEGAAFAQIYYGYFSKDVHVGGLGYLDGRASVGDHDEFVLAHEIGHNFGLGHAPCGRPGFLDADYPFRNGSIGDIGFDPFRSSFLRPYAPDNTQDLMSYCRDIEWISAYHYRKAMADQIAHGEIDSTRPTGDLLLVRVSLSQAGEAELLPSYVLSQTPYQPKVESDHEIELVAANGRILVSAGVALYQSSEERLASPMLLGVAPLPSEEVSLVRVRHHGTLLAERRLSIPKPASTAPLTLGRTAGRDILRWGTEAARPALVRFRDEAGNWTALAVDVEGGAFAVDLATLPKGQLVFEVSQADSSSLAAGARQLPFSR